MQEIGAEGQVVFSEMLGHFSLLNVGELDEEHLKSRLMMVGVYIRVYMGYTYNTIIDGIEFIQNDSTG